MTSVWYLGQIIWSSARFTEITTVFDICLNACLDDVVGGSIMLDVER